jgi:hypothetical protein
MRVGTLSQTIGQNLYNGGWQLINEKVFTEAATSYTISGLDGDTDEEYMLITRFISNYAGTLTYYIRPNNDTGTNYGYQFLDVVNTAIAATRATASAWLCGTTATGTGRGSFGENLINAKSGKVRTILTKFLRSINGLTIEGASLAGQSWNNTADNITSLVVLAGETNGIGIGSHILLFKRQKLGSEATTGMRIGKQELQGKLNVGVFQKIYSTTLTEATTMLAISNLDGDSDIIYKIICRAVNGYNGTNWFYLYPNATYSGICAYQDLMGTDSVIAAQNYGSQALTVGYADALNKLSFFEITLYAKSGYDRGILIDRSHSISGTTVGALWFTGAVFSNGSLSGNITSLTIGAQNSNGVGIGTTVELWALKK